MFCCVDACVFLCFEFGVCIYIFMQTEIDICRQDNSCGKLVKFQHHIDSIGEPPHGPKHMFSICHGCSTPRAWFVVAGLD